MSETAGIFERYKLNYFFVTLIVVYFLSEMLLPGLWGASHLDNDVLFILIGMLLCVLLPNIVFYVALAGKFPDRRFVTPTAGNIRGTCGRAQLALFIVLGCVFAFGATLLVDAVISVMSGLANDTSLVPYAGSSPDFWGVAAIILLDVLLCAAVEELFYRSTFREVFGAHGAAWTVYAVAVFTLAHDSIADTFGALCVGSAAMLIYCRSGSVAAAASLHGAYNLLAAVSSQYVNFPWSAFSLMQNSTMAEEMIAQGLIVGAIAVAVLAAALVGILLVCARAARDDPPHAAPVRVDTANKIKYLVFLAFEAGWFMLMILT